MPRFRGFPGCCLLPSWSCALPDSGKPSDKALAARPLGFASTDFHASSTTFCAAPRISPCGTSFSSPPSSFTSATQCIRVPASCGVRFNVASTVLLLPTPLLVITIRADVGGVFSTT